MPETFQLAPQVDLEVEDEVEELVWNFGSGFNAQAFVGHTSGTKNFRFTYIAPNRTTHQVTDPEDAQLKTYTKYFRDFWLRRKVDGAAFNITDPISGSAVLVKFVGRSLPLKAVTKSCFSIQAVFRQHRS